MKVRTVIVRPPSDDDPIRDLVDFGRSANVEISAETNGLEVSFSLPEYGWILLKISAAGRTSDWDLSWSPDPFVADRYRYHGYCMTWLAWLEDVASGQSATFGIDMEGPVGALLVSGLPASSIVTLLALTGPNHLEFAVIIKRHVLVRDVYTALIAYWDDDALNAAWSQWSDKPKWSLRSRIVEDYLAASGTRI